MRQNRTSSQAVLRERREETGRAFDIERLAFAQERFCTADSTRHHEVAFFYLMKDGPFDIPEGVTHIVSYKQEASL